MKKRQDLKIEGQRHRREGMSLDFRVIRMCFQIPVLPSNCRTLSKTAFPSLEYHIKLL